MYRQNSVWETQCIRELRRVRSMREYIMQVGWIDRRMKLEKWDVSLDADFNNACLDMGYILQT